MGLLPYIPSSGALSEHSLVLFQNATGSIGGSWEASDFVGAVAWVASLLENEERNAALAADVVLISMGGAEVGAEIPNRALRVAMEAEREIPEDDGGRERRRRHRSEKCPEVD